MRGVQIFISTSFTAHQAKNQYMIALLTNLTADMQKEKSTRDGRTTDENVEAIREAFTRSPRESVRQAVETLHNHFPGRWIGRGGPIAWPPRSPDLTPLDFFLWGFVKDRVYNTRVDNLQVLRQRFIDTVRSVTPQILHNAWREIEYRLDVCRAITWGHVEIY
ncbi:hypothetical protein ANN_24133 [Periplaneta americana]|uniref:Uncharacterized protein n=1 Tax=Periplaneta americana TaxID=6978 RepID=A0ABQ8S2J9_PERAM|nr:hypothetical protein ANN_24133 [Periplaneta americana]